jgi:very-short-patch-repair endonuclease
VLHHLGGVATRASLLRLVSRGELQRALSAGQIVRVARGRYTLPELTAALSIAAKVNGALCLTDAALYHGWEIKEVCDKPHIVVPKWRSIPGCHPASIHRVNLRRDQISGMATSPETTLEQCMRWLPFDEALVIADSALRHGFPPDDLRRIAQRGKGPRSPQMRRVAREASPLAANPFESVLRAIALDVRGLSVEPQVWVSPEVRCDLVDSRLRVVLEADSFEWHGGRSALARDARRYNLLVTQGWLVLRFSWEDVMYDPRYVRDVLLAVTALAETLTKVGIKAKKAA